MTKVLIAGASGFIGQNLIRALLENPSLEIIALSRRPKKSDHPRIEWRQCDLFSLKDLNEAMKGANVSYYLVHSMLPSAALSQGSFYDFDLLLADNFARAAVANNLKHLIYLGGMIPASGTLSWHLRSRLEVEQTLRSSQIPVTTLRAGLIIGPNGSSFTILQKLVDRLPLMICPPWTRTLSQPVALSDITKVLVHALDRPEIEGKIYDVGGPEVLNYQDLITKTAHLSGKFPPLLTLPLIPIGLSRLWVSLITSTSPNLVYPLILSLKHEMKVDPKHRWPFPEDLSTHLEASLRQALQGSTRSYSAQSAPKQRDVRSIQRLILPKGKTAEWVSQEFFRWVPSAFLLGVKVEIAGNICTFFLLSRKLKLLILDRNLERSTDDRQLLYIRGGILAGKSPTGRLEFREVLNRTYVMAAIHNYIPALPWFLYRFTQAKIHLWVMRAFGRHLARLSANS